MKRLKDALAIIGFLFVLGTLVFAFQDTAAVETKQADIKKWKSDGDSKNVSESYRISAISIPNDLNFAGEKVPQEDPDIVERIDREFLVNTYWQSNALLLIKRANKFFPIIEPILKKNGIPDDFKYLAVAESGLQNIVSPAGASGFWQIMRATGKEYGLEVNTNVDERYHLEKATQAACDYLNRWKDTFGSWTLTAAAYNAGPAGIRKYMNAQKVKDYYDLMLNKETGRYVFRILAIKEILSHPDRYGFELHEHDLYHQVPTFSVEINEPIASWPGFAARYGTNYKVLKRHNPWIRETHLNNASRKQYEVKIPNKGYYRSSK